MSGKPRAPAVLTVRAVVCRLWLACTVMLAPAHLATAQGGLLLQGVADLEMGKTDSASALLARSAGRLGGLMRADIWAAIEPLRNVVLFGEVFAEGGPARRDAGNEAYARQFAIRYSPSDALGIELGRIPQLIGNFSSRQLSSRNPLVGTPDGYASTYPRGVRIFGNVAAVDYRLGVVSLPLYRPDYTPPPGAAFRPAIGIGITPMTGLRIGMSATVGPYLSDNLSVTMPSGRDWKDYKQRVVAADVQLSRGYFEGHAELAHSEYDIQNRTPIKGLLFYLEPKYTFTPRFFMALRYERNDYPFILPVSPNFWVANRVVFQDVELGGGYRLLASSLVKLSARADHWAPNDNPQAPHNNGFAVVLQWSQSLDFMELFAARPY